MHRWMRAHARACVPACLRRCHRAPDDPGQLLIKRLVAVEGDVVWHAYDDTSAAVKIPKVGTPALLAQHAPAACMHTHTHIHVCVYALRPVQVASVPREARCCARPLRVRCAVLWPAAGPVLGGGRQRRPERGLALHVRAGEDVGTHPVSAKMVHTAGMRLLRAPISMRTVACLSRPRCGSLLYHCEC